MTTNPPEIAPKSAADFLAKASSLLDERGQQYDTGKERSGPKVAVAFNAITGKHLTAAEVYLVLQLTKDARQWSAQAYHQDSAEDCVSYAALKAEELASRVKYVVSLERRSGPANRRKNLYNANDRVFGINRRLSCVFGRRSSDRGIDKDANLNLKTALQKAKWELI